MTIATEPAAPANVLAELRGLVAAWKDEEKRKQRSSGSRRFRTDRALSVKAGVSPPVVRRLVAGRPIDIASAERIAGFFKRRLVLAE